jgi:acetyl-CoA carboxylase beta subunit
MQDAFLIGCGKIKGILTTVVGMNFKFMGGSLSSAGAEAMVKAAEHAVANSTPVIMVHLKWRGKNARKSTQFTSIAEKLRLLFK